jgi:predicted DNA-binding WGR domain protein
MTGNKEGRTMRSFTYVDDKSNKFWNIDLQGIRLTVRFGKVGSTGQTQVKDFADEAAARKEHDKLVAEKLKKGYVEATGEPRPSVPARPGKRREPAPAPELAECQLNDHITRFVGYPVLDYEPRAGVVHAVMPRREFRHVSGDDSFWAVSLDGRRLTTWSGAIGTEGTAEARTFRTPEAAQAEFRKLFGERLGWVFVLPLVRREFHLVKGSSHKVWEVTLLSATSTHFVVRSGTIGPDGNSKARKYKSQKEARKACDELVADRIAKGYTEKAPEAGSLLAALYATLLSNPEDTAARMALTDHLSEQGVTPLANAHRVNGDSKVEGLHAFLADPFVGLVQALVVGYCFGNCGDSPDEAVQALVNARDRLPHLRALFFGDIPYRDQEISWISQGDLTPLLTAFPLLEHFRSRGGGGLALTKFRHERLKSLALEASNLPRGVVRAVGESELPALEHLEIWLGTSEYGADTTAADLKGLLRGKGLPALRYLGLRNSEIADDIARALAGSPLLERLRVLDLSKGTLSDRGAQALLAIPALARLERLDLDHHYVSPAMLERLRDAGIPVAADGPVEVVDADDPDARRYVAHAE